MTTMATAAWGAEALEPVEPVAKSYRGSITALAGKDPDSLVRGNYQITDALQFTGDYEDQVFRGGFDYDFSDHFGIKAGVRYDHDDDSTTNYGGFDFSIPFGTNLELNGFYDMNYEGDHWNRYETVVRIELYKNHFLDAGVMGNDGSGIEIYDYNPDNDAMLFLRGDFNWKFGKFGLRLQPVLSVEGKLFHNYDVTYDLNERLNLAFNMDSRYDRDTRYRAGIGVKF